ncbi:phosphoglycerate mutase [Pseudohyphozyma bogoriensis]|nr:phosphoglycerate mutase [Pseudohyphozyma bogoriensis]
MAPASGPSPGSTRTGKTDIPLTANGEKIISVLGPKIVGPGKLLDPKHIQKAFISPRQRAQTTFQLLFAGSELPPWETEEGVQEWDYGKYEGKTAATIRKEFDPKWQIWEDGCPEGESAEDITKRVDGMIEKIVAMTEVHHDEDDGSCAGDILIVSHGHFTRVFLTRWCALPLSQGRLFVADPGAISICGYQHHNFKERSLLGLNLFGEI